VANHLQSDPIHVVLNQWCVTPRMWGSPSPRPNIYPPTYLPTYLPSRALPGGLRGTLRPRMRLPGRRRGGGGCRAPPEPETQPRAAGEQSFHLRRRGKLPAVRGHALLRHHLRNHLRIRKHALLGALPGQQLRPLHLHL
jgi:hypothetical protein